MKVARGLAALFFVAAGIGQFVILAESPHGLNWIMSFDTGFDGLPGITRVH